MSKIIKIFYFLFLNILLVLIFILFSNIIIKKPIISQNDAHIIQILGATSFFVTYPYNKSKVFTNPIFTYIDNGIEIFKKEKDIDTFRIFCIGGSTTRGLPFHEKLSYPKLLQLFFNDLNLKQKVEVINAGFHGSCSFSDIQLIKEIIRYKPDLIILYAGRNETWNFNLFENKIKNLILRFHVFLIQNFYLYSRIKKFLFKDEKFDHAYFIRKLFYNKNLKKEKVYHKFIQNLIKIHNLCKDNNCKLVLLTQITASHEKYYPEIHHFNKLLVQFSKEKEIILIDVNEKFRSSKLSEIELVIPISVQPNYKGYLLMAKTILEELLKQKIIKSNYNTDKISLNSLLKDDTYYLNYLRANKRFLYETYLNRVLPVFNLKDKSNFKYENFEKEYKIIAKEIYNKINKMLEKKE